MPYSQHILIIGAGICGLSIAHGLQKAGIRYSIFEAENQKTFRPKDWTMALHWSKPMLEELLPADLAARLTTDAVADPSLNYTAYPNNVIPIFDGVSGKLLRELPSDGIRVRRRELRALCNEGIDILFGHKLCEVTYDDEEDSVTAIFSNGASHTGTILIGADGARSAVRKAMFGVENAETTPLDGHHLSMTYSFEDPQSALFARSANPVSATCLHPDCVALIAMQSVPNPQDPQSWSFHIVMMRNDGDNDVGKAKGRGCSEEAQPLSNEQLHALVKTNAAKLPEPFRSAICGMPEHLQLQESKLGYWIPPTSNSWPTHSGRVTLAGDAAHPMPPHRGQGLNNAILDAFKFVGAVKGPEGEGGREEILRAYSREVADRGAKDVELSKETASLVTDYERFRESAMFKQGLKRE